MHELPAHLLAIAGAALGSPWVAWQEARICSKGQKLPPELISWATDQGIDKASDIHFLRSHPIPLPAPLFVRHWFDQRGFPCIHLAGLSLKRGIYLAPNLPDEADVLKHELVHTRQYQKAGSIFDFLRQYLFQCLTQGYHDCDMEREARG